MKKITILLAALSMGMIYAQDGRVGINSSEPKAALDINAITTDNAKGILVPRLTNDLVKTITPSLTADQHSMLAYFTETMPETDRTGNYSLVNTPGYYYWNWNTDLSQSRWVRVAATHEIDLRMVGTNNHITMDGGVGKNGTSAGTGANNVAIGNGSLNAITTGSNNIALGLNSLNKVTTESSLIAIGENALRDNLGKDNMAIGSHAMLRNTDGTGNMAIGKNALRENALGKNNVAIGVNALHLNKKGDNNVAIGQGALYSNEVGNNVAIGPNALHKNTIGVNNVAIGPDVLKINVSGNRNVAAGFESLVLNISGDDNYAGGVATLRYNTTGSQNTAIGNNALYGNTTGNGNVGIGYQTLQANTTGKYNVAVGYNALHASSISGKDYTIGIGYEAGLGVSSTVGNGVIFIGNNQSVMNDILKGGPKENMVLIGNGIDLANNDISSNTIVLGNAEATGVSGGTNVGIGVYKPKAKLEVNGAVKIGTSDTCNADTEGSIRYDKTAKKFQGCTIVGVAYNWVNLN